ncbi:MAG: cysteine hydrolase family protein [Coriobacteriia bacterium]
MDTNSSLLVVDVQRALFERPIPIYKGDELLDTLCELVDRAHKAGAIVVFIQHCNKMMPHGSDAWQLHPRLRPEDGDLLVEKTHGDAFEGTRLDDELRARGVSSVVVTGLVTHGCVTATCRGGKYRGYSVTLVSDGHSNYNRKAPDLISECNTTLGEELTAVVPAHEVSFRAAG